MGHPDYEVTSGSIVYQSSCLKWKCTRARFRHFLSFQYPSVIPGVQVGTFLRKIIKGEHAPSAREFRNHYLTKWQCSTWTNPSCLAM